MTGRERIKRIFQGRQADRVGVWIGAPHWDTTKVYYRKLGFGEIDDLDYYNTISKLHNYFEDDVFVFQAEYHSYRHPEGRPLWDFYDGKTKQHHSQPGCFAEYTSVKQVEAYDNWPDVKYFDFSDIIEMLRLNQDKAVFSGLWTPFFHIVSNFFGMENYFMKMYTHPEVVEAVTIRILNFYLEANEKFFVEAGDLFDVFFFGNDFGSQNSLLVSPDCFRKFVLPGIRAIVNLAKKYGKFVLFHCCGAINEVIPLLIEAGIDGLHPLQAKAKEMSADSLAEKYKGQIAFVGAVDTQDLLVNSTPQQIHDEVCRLKDILGPRLIVSPSHETLLPNVPIENVKAMVAAIINRK